MARHRGRSRAAALITENPGLHPDDTVAAATAAAQEWLAQLPPDPPCELPPVVRVVAARARASAANSPGPAASVRIPGRDGTWFELHAAPLVDEPAIISLTIGPVPVGRIAPLLLASFELSPREQVVLSLLIQGAGTDQIARRLFISRHTVRDHTKAIFAKTRVSSRHELVARVRATVEPHLG